jgi:hypothetical protein
MNITPMKFPYGIANFAAIRQEGYFYQDRTHLIPSLEAAGKQLLFLRPRRFGKSLLLSMLEHYYDIDQADSFASLFGDLTIGQNPTPLHNRYFIVHWDFSDVSCQGEVSTIENALHEHINDRLKDFIARYQSRLSLPVQINESNALSSWRSALTAVRQSGHTLYLFIDEYDNFANEILMARKDQYEALLYGEGLFKTVFKAVKAAAGQGLDRVFITGVSPVALSDITSGYNVATNIYLEPEFNALCGFTEAEMDSLVKNLIESGITQPESVVMATLRTFYNGYRFAEEEVESVYNPTLSLYFLKTLQKQDKAPKEMLDDNLAMDRKRLLFIAGLLEGETLLVDALSQEQGLVISRLSRRFGAETMLKQERDRDTIISLLYYFGILTLGGIVGLNKLAMKIPNLVSRSLYIEQLQDIYLSSAEDRQSLSNVPDGLFLTGDLQPVCEFIETRLFPVLSNRDYRWSNELAIKVIFMMVLFNDRVYMMVSEAEVQHGYADLSLIVRPDMRRFQALDLVLEFKYLGLKELGLSGEEVKSRSREALSQIPSVAEKLKEAREQVLRYGQVLKSSYNLATITGFAVVALGLERVVFERIE